MPGPPSPADPRLTSVPSTPTNAMPVILRVNVQLISAETGAHLWSDRFNEEIRQLAAGQERIVARLSDTIGFSMTDIEAARSLRERPTNPDAFDLVLRARSLAHLPLM